MRELTTGVVVACFIGYYRLAPLLFFLGKAFSRYSLSISFKLVEIIL